MPDTAPESRELEPREQEAIRLAQSGALAEAEVMLKEILDDRPDDHQILNAAGAVAAQQGKLVDAYPLFQKADALAPQDPSITGNLAAVKRALAARAIEGDADRTKTRFNIGVAGRGEELTDAQKDRIRHLASNYADVDFGPVGL